MKGIIKTQATCNSNTPFAATFSNTNIQNDVKYKEFDSLTASSTNKGSKFYQSRLRNTLNTPRNSKYLETNRNTEYLAPKTNRQEKLGSYKSNSSSKAKILIKMKAVKVKSKGVRFRERVSIDNNTQPNMFDIEKLTSLDPNKISQNREPNDLLESQKFSILNSLAKDRKSGLPLESSRKAKDIFKTINQLINSHVLSTSSAIYEIKCFMTHHSSQSSQLINKKFINKAKFKLKQADVIEMQEVMSASRFQYDAFANFLKTLSELNYDSHQTFNSFQNILDRYNYPVSIKLMLFYLGSFLYQLNSMYDKAERMLRQMLSQMIKYKIYQFIGIYLILMAKLKANLLEWESASQFLIKLLAYAWHYNLEDLQIWVYFQLSRAYFFMDKIQQCEFYRLRSEMSLCEPKGNIYRGIIASNFQKQVEQIRLSHKSFSLNSKLAINQLQQIGQRSIQTLPISKANLKIQSQIKGIHQKCNIKYVKDLANRINCRKMPKTVSCQNYSKNNFYSTINNHYGKLNASKLTLISGNPLFRTHESGLKNLNVYFRNTQKGRSLIGNNQSPKMYTFEDSNKNILVIKQMARNILIQMKYFVPLSTHQHHA